ncbi:protein ripply1 [Mus musculus]|uniref:Protein ripply1 n=1 Tax=Mus musculus TaxID=10090 RepID=RIPP1_MOUSE|nr:protein ripply1 [Mus musculus]Q2WG77.1 RecName: Full=Protein ripply1 [Mus musculus]AAI56676.1 Ripply1 homolog (zebrafish) [synthetic construct]BAE53719.1 Ripply1 [Mus musculus]|eukprot:NP_001033004.1 protein ripply1 [Mus musculus]
MDPAASPAAAPPAAPAAAPAADPAADPAAALPGQALAQAPALAQINGQEGARNERAAYLWRPWLSSINDQPRQARSLVDWADNRATAAEAAKTDSDFHHPVRLYWPKSHSFDYLYSAGEILLNNFPVQATINLYEDSDSADNEEDKEEEEEEEEEEDDEEEEEDEDKDVNENEPEVCMGVSEATTHKATAHSPDPHSACPN